MTPSDTNDVGTIPLRDSAEGVILPVHAMPGSRRKGICGCHNGRLKLAVTQVAEKGKANKEFVKVLVDALQVNRSTVSLRSGELTQLKEFVIRGLSVDEVRARLAAAWPRGSADRSEP